MKKIVIFALLHELTLIFNILEFMFKSANEFDNFSNYVKLNHLISKLFQKAYHVLHSYHGLWMVIFIGYIFFSNLCIFCIFMLKMKISDQVL